MSTDEIRTTHTIIPAAPGWFVAKLAEYCEPFFEFHPIVAWEVEHGQVSRDRYRIAVPVLPCGLTDGFDDFLELFQGANDPTVD